MNDEQGLREKLRKIEALFAGAATPGEREAAAAAIGRIKKRLETAAHAEPPIEMKFSLPDLWSRKLFVALCRRYGLKPYRYPGQRRTTVVVRLPRSFMQAVLWPEFVALNDALVEYLAAATDRIIREEVNRDVDEAPEQEAMRQARETAR